MLRDAEIEWLDEKRGAPPLELTAVESAAAQRRRAPLGRPVRAPAGRARREPRAACRAAGRRARRARGLEGPPLRRARLYRSRRLARLGRLSGGACSRARAPCACGSRSKRASCGGRPPTWRSRTSSARFGDDPAAARPRFAARPSAGRGAQRPLPGRGARPRHRHRGRHAWWRPATSMSRGPRGATPAARSPRRRSSSSRSPGSPPRCRCRTGRAGSSPRLRPRGRLADARVEWRGQPEAPAGFAARANSSTSAPSRSTSVPGFAGITGSFDATESGARVVFATEERRAQPAARVSPAAHRCSTS